MRIRRIFIAKVQRLHPIYIHTHIVIYKFEYEFLNRRIVIVIVRVT